MTHGVGVVIQERANLKSERDNFKRRLLKAEQDVVDAKEQCVTLTNSMQQLQREVCARSLSYSIVVFLWSMSVNGV